MLFVLILSIVLIGLSFMFYLMTRAFNTIPVDYTENPGDLGMDYASVRFPTKNNLSLHGWWIPAKNGPDKPLLILLHGWRRNCKRMLPYAEALHADYNLFVFDSRNHGKSDSDTFSSMPRFTEDIIAALDYLQEEYSGKHSGETGIIGLSMGGAAAIYAAALDERIKSVVTVGAFANAADVMRQEYSKRHIPYFPLVYLVFEYFQYHIGLRFREFAPENNIGKSKADFLIVHGKVDQTAPFSHAERLIASARDGKASLLAIDHAGHSDCHEFDSFWPGVKAFLIKTLNIKAGEFSPAQ